MFVAWKLIRATFYLAVSYAPGHVKSDSYALSNLITVIFMFTLQMRQQV